MKNAAGSEVTLKQVNQTRRAARRKTNLTASRQKVRRILFTASAGICDQT